MNENETVKDPHKMTAAEHKARHVELHRSLDELIADFYQFQVESAGLTEIPKLGHSTLHELMEWSYQQQQSASPWLPRGAEHRK